MITKIYVIRHGITEGNIKDWFYGKTDLPITDIGRNELHKLKSEKIYPNLEKAQYFTSGMLRTEETFDIIFGDIPHGQIHNLKEIDFGEYECKTYGELKDEPPFLAWSSDTTGETFFPGGESRNEFNSRVEEGLEELIKLKGTTEEGNPVVAVLHGGVISKIIQTLFPNEDKTVWDIIPDPGHGYEILFEDGTPIEYRGF